MSDDVRCPGCGRRFRNQRALRAHQSVRFQTLACKPSKVAEQ